MLGNQLHWLMEQLLPAGASALPDTLSEEVLEQLKAKLDEELPPTQRAVAGEVLVQTVERWREYERDLEWEYRVEQTETLLEGRDHCGIPYRVKLDRVDSWGDKKVILDYKSGSAGAAGIMPLGKNGIQLALYGIFYKQEHGCPDGLLYAWMDMGGGSPALAGILDESLQDALKNPGRRVQFVNMQEYLQKLEAEHKVLLEQLMNAEVGNERAGNTFYGDSLLLLRPPSVFT